MTEFKPIPGYEGLYSITKLGQIRHDKFKRMKHTTVTKRGQEIVVLSKNGIPVMYTVKSLIDLTWNSIPIKTNKGSAKAHSKKIKCITTNNSFNSYRECCEHYEFDYKKFISKTQSYFIYKGLEFMTIN